MKPVPEERHQVRRGAAAVFGHRGPDRELPAGRVLRLRHQQGRALIDRELYLPNLVTRSLDPTRAGQVRWTMRWKPALNAFAITFADRFSAAEAY
jgi:hypothetical protein